MISEVSFEKTTYNDIPYKFEAGTPNIADVIAFKEAITFVNSLGNKSNLLSTNKSCWPQQRKNSMKFQD
jgi:selenocysteine lyase/cysteine desulfurase